MQEEANDRSASLVIQPTKLTTRTFKRLLEKAFAEMKAEQRAQTSARRPLRPTRASKASSSLSDNINGGDKTHTFLPQNLHNLPDFEIVTP